MLASIGEPENVVVETILVVPKRHAVDANVVHGLRNVNEVLEEFAGDVFVSDILLGEFQGDGQHVQAIHAHPTGAVRLFEMASGRKRSGTIEDSDVIESEEAALKNVRAVGVLAIDPPGEIEQ